MTISRGLEVLPLSEASSQQVQDFLRGTEGELVRKQGLLYLVTPHWQQPLPPGTYLIKVRGALQKPVDSRELVRTYGRHL